MENKENVYKQLRESTETNVSPALTQEQLSNKFKEEGNPVSQSVISKTEKNKKMPPTTSFEVIKAYSEHFNVTSDYLLGLRDTKQIDENVAMINKVTGLNENSIETLRILKNDKNIVDILNYIMSDYLAFGTFLNNLLLYFYNDFDTPVHYDAKLDKYVESTDDSLCNPISNLKKERFVTIGKKIKSNTPENTEYETIYVPVSILESHTLHLIQQSLDTWKNDFKKE